MWIANLVSALNINRLVALASWLVMVGCVVLVAYVGVSAVWSIAAGPTPDDSTVMESNTSFEALQPIDLDPILAANLFGRTSIDVGMNDVADLKETTLNLSLEGTFIDSESMNATVALIANRDGSGAPREYHPGDAIAGFAKIESIQARLVVISRNGERERLTFPEHGIFKSDNQILPGLIRDTSVVEAATQRPRSPEELPSQWDMDRILDLGLAETESQGALALTVVETDGTSILGRLGMRTGDVVSSINDVPLQQLKENQELASEVLASGVARFEIKRNDRDFVITLPLP